MVTVTNVTGQQILRKQFQPTGSRFAESIELSGAAKGIYFVELIANGERLMRSIVIE